MSDSPSLDVMKELIRTRRTLSAELVGLSYMFSEALDAIAAFANNPEGVDVEKVVTALKELANEATPTKAIERWALEASKLDRIAITREKIAADRLAALRQSKVPPLRTKTDGSRIEEWGDDATGKAMERDRLLAGTQAARHAALAGNRHISSEDVHQDTRKIRAEMYKKLEAESQ